MASQGERVLGVVGMCSLVNEAMVQDKIPVQDTPEQDIIVQEQFLPQLNPEPEMGAAAAAVYDTSLPSSETLPRSLPKRLTQAHPTWPSYSPCWRK